VAKKKQGETAERRTSGSRYQIDVRSIVKNDNPRNALPEGVRKARTTGPSGESAPWELFTGRHGHGGSPIDLWTIGTSDQADYRVRFCQVMENDEEFVGFASTFLTLGQLKAIEVRDNGRDSYTLVDGCRRALAVLYNWCKKGGEGIPWIEIQLSPKVNATELLYRSEAHNDYLEPGPMERARLVQRMANQNQSIEEIAVKRGKSESWVRNQLALCALPEDVQKKIEAGQLKPSKALEKARTQSNGDSEEGEGDGDPPAPAKKPRKTRLQPQLAAALEPIRDSLVRGHLDEMTTSAVEEAPEEMVSVSLTRAQARVLLDLLGGAES
jgi:hypothetical protein